MHKGQVVYFGDTLDSIIYFGSFGFQCPAYMNPADYFLDLLEETEEEDEGRESVAEKHPLTEVQISAETANFSEIFNNSPQGKALKERMENEHHFNTKSSIAALASSLKKTSYPLPAWKQTFILTQRTLKASLPDAGLYIRTAAAIVMGLLVGAIFYDQTDDAESVQNKTNTLLFAMCVFSLFCLPAIGRYLEERLLFTREHASGYYRTSAYAISSFTVELPILVITVISYGVAVYWLVGFEKSVECFLFFLAIIFLIINVGFGLCQVLAASFRTTNMAIAIYMLILVYSLLLGSFQT